MNRIKIITVVGARPQFIKAAAVSHEFQKHEEIQEILVHTGQHFDENMSEIFFEEMNIPRPKYNLDVHSLSHGAMTGRMLEGIEEIITKESPDAILVYGDTNSTIAGALAAKKLHVKVIHVESGLRSFNMNMPEEINRILTDRISDILYCPTEQAIINLKKEGFDHLASRIVKCGDVMQDAANYFAQQLGAERLSASFDFDKYVLCTFHRAENTDDPERLKQIVNAINELNKTIPVVIPLHPRSAGLLEKAGLTLDTHINDPVGYIDMIDLIQNCELVMTDSGGLQKEAFFFQKPCLTLRDETEWIELVEHGFNTLAGADTDKILNEAQKMLSGSFDFNVNLYGNGTASNLIAQDILSFFGNN